MWTKPMPCSSPAIRQQASTPDQADSIRLNIIHTLILEAIIDQRAAKQGLTATDAEVEAKLAEMKAPYTEEQFQAKLKAANLTLDELKRDVRRSLTQEKLINKEINSRITVTDADVRTTTTRTRLTSTSSSPPITSLRL